MLKIGVICPSEIAFRRFMPSIFELKDEIEYVGLAVPCANERFSKMPDKETVDSILHDEQNKAKQFVERFGGKLFESYESIVSSPEIDAVYIPLPPALHFKWAQIALKNGKHVLLEKPFTTSLNDTLELVKTASKKGLALHENYMFAFHEQIKVLQNFINSGNIGDVRLYRLSFGFPKREANDFRYNKSLGGGALIDAGGYTLKYANILLGDSIKVLYSKLNYTNDYDVDLYGSGALCNKNGDVVQISFGMDNEYKCELEAWGSKGFLSTGRVFTAPDDFTPSMIVKKENTVTEIKLPSDKAFKKSITYFLECIKNNNVREQNYNSIIKQAKLLDEFLNELK